MKPASCNMARHWLRGYGHHFNGIVIIGINTPNVIYNASLGVNCERLDTLFSASCVNFER